jgi:hypothetical protein
MAHDATMNLSPSNPGSLPSILHRPWFPWLVVVLLAGGLCSICSLGSLIGFRTALYPGAAWMGTQGTTLSAQGGVQTGMATLATRNVFSTESSSVSDISTWYRTRGWQPRFRANTSEGTTYIHTRVTRFGALRVELQTRVTALYDLSPPRLLVHTYLTISW